MGPQPYPVVWNADDAQLEYVFQDGQIAVPVSGGGSAGPGGSFQLSDGNGGFSSTTDIQADGNGAIGIGPGASLLLSGNLDIDPEAASTITFNDNVNPGLANNLVTLRGDNTLGGNFTVQTGGPADNVFLFTGDGLLDLPPLSTTQINATTPAEGAVAYDGTLHVLKFYNGTAWKIVATV